MLFNSLHFLIFLPIVLLAYYTLPKRVRYLWLLAASYYFYMCWNARYAVLILFSTVVTYGTGILIDAIGRTRWPDGKKTRWRKGCVFLSFVLNLGILFFFKYFDFATENLTTLLRAVNIELHAPAFDVLLPVGISFYTFQALGYTVDVYRGEIRAERNLFRYALFVSFFPQLVAGPIERSKNLLTQLAHPQKMKFDHMREGVFLILWGYFLKVVLADRIAIYVDAVYGDYGAYPGSYLIVATLLFSIQIYCDFYGYSVIAMGTAKMLGIDLMENFNAPYLSRSVSEFWRRWHISLSTWFRDYVYIPLGGSRVGRLRRYFNVLVTFAISGLWHGAQWNYVTWGLLNGLYQVIGDALKPIRHWSLRVLGLKTPQMSHHMLRILTTGVLINLSWVFFRAPSFRAALHILKDMLTVWNPWVLLDGSLYTFGLDAKSFHFMLLCIGVLLVADVLKYRGMRMRHILAEQDGWFQSALVAVTIWLILLVGIWGKGYDATSFIYFQF